MVPYFVSAIEIIVNEVVILHSNLVFTKVNIYCASIIDLIIVVWLVDVLLLDKIIQMLDMILQVAVKHLVTVIVYVNVRVELYKIVVTIDWEVILNYY